MGNNIIIGLRELLSAFQFQFFAVLYDKDHLVSVFDLLPISLAVIFRR